MPYAANVLVNKQNIAYGANLLIINDKQTEIISLNSINNFLIVFVLSFNLLPDIPFPFMLQH